MFHSESAATTAVSAVTSDRLLDYGGLDLYSSLLPRYFEQSLRFDLVVPAQMTVTLPENFELPTLELVDRYNPNFVSGYKPAEHFLRFGNFYLDQNPDALVATIISGTNCRRKFVYYPVEAVNCSAFPDDALLFNTFGDPDSFLVDISVPEYSRLLADLIIEEALTRPYPLLYLDNIVHPHYLYYAGTNITGETIASHVGYIRERLNEHGIALIINLAVVPSYLATGGDGLDAAQLARIVDGVSFETPLGARSVRTHFGLVQDAIEVFRHWLASDKILLFVPQLSEAEGAGDIETQLQDKQFMAAFALLIREQGDPIRLSSWYWLEADQFPWRTWPEAFGAAVAPLHSQTHPNGWVLTREFRGGTVGLQHVTLPQNTSLTFNLPIRDAQNLTLVSGPIHGGLDTARFPNVKYTPAPNFSGVDGFTFRQDGNNQTLLWVVGIYVDGSAETCLIYNDQRTNRRAGPGTDYPVQDVVLPDLYYTVNSQSVGNDGYVWWELVTGEWVRSDAVQEIGSCDKVPFITVNSE